jgi:hypothetical protein
VYINRAKALLLVGTISAGCAPANDEGPDNPGGAGPGGAGSGGTSSAGGSGQSGGGSGGTSSAGGSSSSQGGGGAGGTPSAGGSGPSDPDAGNAGSGGLDAGGPDAGGPDAGGPDSGAPAGRDAGADAGTPACIDTPDTVVSCSTLGQTECVGLEGFLSSECEMVAFVMKPATANVARNCMLALDPPELCDATNTYACLADALGTACPDPEADDECTVIGAACDDSGPAFSACSSALSGMTQSGRDQMVQCMTGSCDLYGCVEGLTLP